MRRSGRRLAADPGAFVLQGSVPTPTPRRAHRQNQTFEPIRAILVSMTTTDSSGANEQELAETGSSPELIEHAIELARKESYEEALPIFEQHLPGLTGGDIGAKRLAARAFSYYGLCVAMVRRKYAEAVEYCNISLKANFLDPDHRYNLAMVYLERDDRRHAVEALNAGLRLAPNNTRLKRIFDLIGRRKPPVIGFLGRSNPVNIWLGKMLRGGGGT